MTDSEEKNERIKELEALVALLRAQLKSVRATVASYQKRAAKRWHDDYDHVEYQDDDRR